MKKIKIGQIGVSHEHAGGKIQTLRSMPEVFEIVGVVDDRDTTAARYAGDNLAPYEGLPWMTEDELFNTPGLQAVAVETPNTELVPTAMRCAERGLHMHMDKPAGEDLEAFRQLLDACRERKLAIQLGYMFRSNPAMKLCFRAVRAGWLGDVFQVQAGMNHDYGGERYQSYLANFRGGITFNLGCHLIDLTLSILGRPDKITGFSKTTRGARDDVSNNGLAVLEYPHAIATLHACGLEADGIGYRRLTVCGTKGTIELSPLERFDGKPLQMRLTLREDNEEYTAGTHTVDLGVVTDRYQDQLLELAQTINGEIENPYPYEHELLVQETLLAAAGYMEWR
ncbi:MAG: Gfo/Idh/MocA family oxidoreductase [Lentisphaeria bacterium]|nr:Gfo/Idh/MocA family oxidoreductase [Lentisphaeria bacterium]